MIDAKPFVKTLKKKPVAVFGLGKSGLSVVRACVKAGAKVHAWDDNEDNLRKAKKLGADAVATPHDAMAQYGTLILSPGVPLYHPQPHPVVDAAREAGIEIIGDIELLHRCVPDVKTIGVTGTNGKSTTTALIAHILKTCKQPMVLGGNIGKPVMDLKLPKNKDAYVVLELSSYQLDLCTRFAPDIAVHLNLGSDHLDRHGTMDEYIAAKERIFRGSGVAVIGVDDDDSAAMAARVEDMQERKTLRVSVARDVADGIYVDDGVLFDASGDDVAEVLRLKGLASLTGRHNHQNAACAYAAAKSARLDPAQIADAIATFDGLNHRQYVVRSINGIPYINDSKATNAQAAAVALDAYDHIYWILGGRAKPGGLNGLEPYMAKIAQAFLIGEAEADFATWLRKQDVPVNLCGDLKNAVMQAHKVAQMERGQPGGKTVVLLSPACASWDQFASFEDRGDVFAEIVLALDDEVRA